MNSIQESTNELNAAIRYAENAITSAKQTIESMQFRQDMAKKQYTEQTGREQGLLKKLEVMTDKHDKMKGYADRLLDENGDLEERNDELNIQIVEQTNREATLEREVTINTAQANAWKKEYDKIKDQYQGLYDDNVRFKREIADLKAKLVEDIPNMPTIPKDVAIAIFREGIKQGVEDACCEIDNSDSIEIEESGYTGGFEVSFSKYVDLNEYLDTDWMRSKVGSYEEEFAIIGLRGLCETKGFECRIHGIDEKKTPKIQ